MPTMPKWNTPANLAEALDEGDGSWEDERWSPILLTAMSGTELDGREIPVAWQIEFDPSEEQFEEANSILEEIGLEPDGYGWGEYIQKSLQDTNAPLAERLHLNDCEAETCVIWVASEDDCRTLLETTWKLIFKE